MTPRSRWMISLLVTLLFAAAAAEARAEGFATKDISGFADQAASALGAGFQHRAEPARVTLTCPSCKGAPIIDVLIGRQDDGTEGRVRSGATSMSQMEAVCRRNSPSCKLVGLEVAPAVGWITTYSIGSMAGSTAVILRDGDLLTVRSIASDEAVAKRNAETLVRFLSPRLVKRR